MHSLYCHTSSHSECHTTNQNYGCLLYYIWRLTATFPIAPMLRQAIFISLDPMRTWIASKMQQTKNMKQAVTSWLQTVGSEFF
jgi:hypothetical protein